MERERNKIGVDFERVVWHGKNMINTDARGSGPGANVGAEIPIDDKKNRMDVTKPGAPSTRHPRKRLTFQVQKNG